MAVITEQESALDDDLLKRLEERLGISLPVQYRDFLLVHNGGRPRPSVFHYLIDADRTGKSCVDWFLAVYDGEYDNFEEYFSTFKTESNRLPFELVPIAHDPGGNLICIAVSGSCRGSVFFWDHEFECDVDECPSIGDACLISHSFVEFLNNLSES